MTQTQESQTSIQDAFMGKEDNKCHANWYSNNINVDRNSLKKINGIVAMISILSINRLYLHKVISCSTNCIVHHALMVNAFGLIFLCIECLVG